MVTKMPVKEGINADSRMRVGWGMYRHLRVGRERFNGDGHRRKFKQGVGVAGRVFQGGVLYSEHGEDLVPGKSPLGEGMGRRGPDVPLPSRPNIGSLLRSVARSEQI